MRVTIVMENCIGFGGKSFRAEHGLSVLLDMGEEKWLLDAGQSDATVHNLGLLGVSPKQLAGVMLSHGHYDHAGGLAHLLEQSGRVLPVYYAPGAFICRYASSSGKKRYIGIPHTKEMLETMGADLRAVNEPLQIAEKLWLSGPIPRVTDFENETVGFVDETGVNDPVADDMSLFFAGKDGLTVITGCAHAGIINIIKYGMTITGCNRLHGVIGGTHLGPLSPGCQEATIKALKDFSPDFIAANHCTGFNMMARLQEQFRNKFIPAFVGTAIDC